MLLETHNFEFGEFVLDPRERVLFRNGAPVPVAPKVLQLLLVLIENHDHIVEKEKLMEEVWADSFVEESNLTYSIRQLRKVLGDDIQKPHFIETIPRRGYRFIAGVDASAANGSKQSDLPESPADKSRLESWRSRPVFLVLAAVSLGIVLLSAGAYVWWDRSSESGKRSLELNSNLKFETLVSADRPMTAAISPDGKYVAYSRTTNGLQSLWLQQLSSRVKTQIVAPEEGTIYHSIEFSSDGEFIYFSRRYKDEEAHIDRVSILGGNPKIGILRNVDGAFSISPDDRLISFRRYAPEKRSLLIANIDGSNERILFETTKTFTDNVFSPDGRTIAFASGQSDSGDQDFGVYTIDIETGELNAAADVKWVHARSIAWLPDQSGLLVTAASATGAPLCLWQISRPDGVVKKIIDSQTGFALISTTKDMSQILLMQTVRSSNLYIAASSVLDELRPLVEAAEGLSWAPDGGLVYSSGRDIWKMNSDKMTQRQLTTEESNDIDPKVSPDGRHVVFVSDRAGKYNIWRMNADGSNAIALTKGEGEQEPVLTTDGSFVIFSSMKNPGLWKVPIEGGEPTLIFEKRVNRISLSPDGTKFAHIIKIDGKRKIVIRSFVNNEAVQQFDMPAGYFFGGDIVWSDKDKALLYIANDSNNVGNLWGQSLDGGPHEKLTHYTTSEIFYFAFSPDHAETALIRGSWHYEAVLLNGLQPMAIK
jgi:DNA-binding winged helix-turn-helix (wHTH) protein/Tol biopolymer transport system component